MTCGARSSTNRGQPRIGRPRVWSRHKTVPSPPIRRVRQDPDRLQRWVCRSSNPARRFRQHPEVGKTWPARYKCGMLLMAHLVPPIANTDKRNLFGLGAQA